MEPALVWLSRRHGIENIDPCISGWTVAWLSATPLHNLRRESHAEFHPKHCKNKLQVLLACAAVMQFLCLLLSLRVAASE